MPRSHFCAQPILELRAIAEKKKFFFALGAAEFTIGPGFDLLSILAGIDDAADYPVSAGFILHAKRFINCRRLNQFLIWIHRSSVSLGRA
jgi:hypothetical protein